jgi:IS5 family transposase
MRYRGIAKKHHRLCANFMLASLYPHRKHLVKLGQ